MRGEIGRARSGKRFRRFRRPGGFRIIGKVAKAGTAIIPKKEVSNGFSSKNGMEEKFANDPAAAIEKMLGRGELRWSIFRRLEVGHTLILWSVSLLACPTEGQVAVETPGSKPCASCQAAQAAEAQQNQPSPYYSSPSRGGLLGLGIWDRIRGRFTAGSSRPQQQQNPELGTPIIENGSIAVDMPVIRNAEPPLNSPGAVPASFQSSASAQAPARTAQHGPGVLPYLAFGAGSSDDYAGQHGPRQNQRQIRWT